MRCVCRACAPRSSRLALAAGPGAIRACQAPTVACSCRHRRPHDRNELTSGIGVGLRCVGRAVRCSSRYCEASISAEVKVSVRAESCQRVYAGRTSSRNIAGNHGHQTERMAEDEGGRVSRGGSEQESGGAERAALPAGQSNTPASGSRSPLAHEQPQHIGRTRPATSNANSTVRALTPCAVTPDMPSPASGSAIAPNTPSS